MIVEDQALIGLALEAYLEEMGFGDCETLPSGAAALDWLATNRPSIAILDYSLRDGPCTRLVRALQERDIPFVIYSGHKRTVAPPDLQHVPWLNKPCDRPALLAALTRVAPALTTCLSQRDRQRDHAGGC
jgi:DNA-binding NtrC family response regulator